MLNWFALLLLGATALAPMLGAIAINQISQGMSWEHWAPWLSTAVGSALVCWLLLEHLRSSGERHTFSIHEFEDKDKEVVAFLLTYLLPFMASKKLEFEGEWLTGTYILAIILITIVHAGAFHFNPVMGLFFHFYAVKDKTGVSTLLISRRPLGRIGEKIEAVKLAHNVYLGRN